MTDLQQEKLVAICRRVVDAGRAMPRRLRARLSRVPRLNAGYVQARMQRLSLHADTHVRRKVSA